MISNPFRLIFVFYFKKLQYFYLCRCPFLVEGVVFHLWMPPLSGLGLADKQATQATRAIILRQRVQILPGRGDLLCGCHCSSLRLIPWRWQAINNANWQKKPDRAGVEARDTQAERLIPSEGSLFLTLCQKSWSCLFSNS